MAMKKSGDGRWRLLARKLAGEASQDELTAFEEMVRKNGNWHLTFDITLRFWQARQEVTNLSRENAQRLLKRIKKESAIKIIK